VPHDRPAAVRRRGSVGMRTTATIH
jgi:hypothetical protein